jgi:predicted RNA-binding protein with TRAM domain
MLPEKIRCVFTGRVERRNGRYIVELPEREVNCGSLTEGDLYQVGVLNVDTSSADDERESPSTDSTEASKNEVEATSPTAQKARQKPGAGAYQGGSDTQIQSAGRGPPVEENETRVLTVEDMGDQGDGLARVEHGYIVFVPETSVGDEVRVEMETIKKNFAFAKVIERNPSQPNLEKDSPVAN